MLYTRKGDTGTSSLFGSKKRLPKNHLIYDALGTLDELNSFLGLCRAMGCNNQGEMSPVITAEILPELLKAQECLFIIQAELAGAKKSISQVQVDEIENTIDAIEKMIQKPTGFVIAGANPISAWCDYTRTISRRAERVVISAQSERVLSPPTMAYLNRLSSLLYSLSRYCASLEKVTEISPSYN